MIRGFKGSISGLIFKKVTSSLKVESLLYSLQDSGDFNVVVIMEPDLKHNVANDSAP